jgi:hypothetical protein
MYPSDFSMDEGEFMKARAATNLRRQAQFMSAAVLLIAGGFAGRVAAQQDPTPGVVKILTHGEGDGTQREGSGFVLGFAYGFTFIATAAHVIEGDSHPIVVFAAVPHLTYEATPVRIAEDSDIAVLKMFGFVPGSVLLPFDSRPVELADPLQAIGFPRRALQPRLSTAAASSKEGGKIVLDEQLAEGHSGGPLLREGLVVGLVNATEGDFAYATPALFLSQILESWKVPFQVQTTRRTAIAQGPKTDDTGSSSGQLPPMPAQIPPASAGCFGVVTSRTGSGQPVRALASPSAPALLSLPAGTQVAVETSQASSGYRWYQIAFDATQGRQLGWMQADHLQVSEGCRK